MPTLRRRVRAGDVADVDAADADGARVQLVKAGDEVADGGLAAARRADERDRRALAHGEAEVIEHSRLAAFLIFIREAHVVELDVAAQLRDGQRVLRLALFGEGEHLAEPAEPREAVLDLFKQVDEGADGGEQHGHIQDEGGEVAAVDPIEAEEQAAREQGDEVEKVVEQPHPSLEDAHVAVGSRARLLERAVGGVELFLLPLLGGVRLGDADAGDRGFDLGVDFGDLLARAGKGAVHTAAHLHREEDHQRHEQRDDERQPRVDEEQHNDRARDADEGGEGVLRAVVGELARFKQVVDDARHDRARARLVEIGKGKALDVAEKTDGAYPPGCARRAHAPSSRRYR